MLQPARGSHSLRITRYSVNFLTLFLVDLFEKITTAYGPTGWRRGVVVSGVRRMNEVNARWARLVPGWVTVFGRVYHLGM